MRLRDLVDLLQKANVGQNSYAIMGQGMVDEVLSLSPQDRRSLIDEAADVKRFRAKIAGRSQPPRGHARQYGEGSVDHR